MAYFGLGGSGFSCSLLFLYLLVHVLDKSAVLRIRIEHFQGSASGIDFVVVRAFQDMEQLFVPSPAPDLYIAGAALRAERSEARELVAARRGSPGIVGAERTHQV